MAFIYHEATLSNLDLLVQTRIQVLRAANKLSDDTDLSIVEAESYAYYRCALTDGSHAGYLVFDGEKFVGCGGVSFFQVMPTYSNPSGYKAYIMNMYTHPSYRRQGIAYKTLDLLIAKAKAKGITQICLEATQMGRPLYEKYGFEGMPDEMMLPREV